MYCALGCSRAGGRFFSWAKQKNFDAKIKTVSIIGVFAPSFFRNFAISVGKGQKG
jgi:hypothetical protein